MSAGTDLLVLPLRVFPERIREGLRAEYALARTEKEGCEGSGFPPDSAGSGKERWSPGRACHFAACGEGTPGGILERR